MTAPFTSDGCTVVADLDQQWICIWHDFKFWAGGSYSEFGKVNAKFFSLIERYSEYKVTGPLRWLGVTIGALHIWPTKSRWGFGNRWPRYSGQPGDPYTVASEYEKAIRMMNDAGAPPEAMVELWGLKA